MGFFLRDLLWVLFGWCFRCQLLLGDEDFGYGEVFSWHHVKILVDFLNSIVSD